MFNDETRTIRDTLIEDALKNKITKEVIQDISNKTGYTIKSIRWYISKRKRLV